MKINNVDISIYNARQWRVEFGPSDMKHDSEWVRGSPLPFFNVNYRGFKEVTVTLLVYGSSRENIRNKLSEITALLLDPAELILDGYVRKFNGILNKTNVSEGSDSARKRFQKLELQFNAYECGGELVTTATGITEIQVTNPGNLISPAIIEITPQIGIAELAITGICRDSNNGAELPVTVRKLTTGKKVVLDGVNGLITENGQLKDADIWALPTLLPGSNKITLSNNRMDVTIKILPMYL